jgi:hypothetical protein
MLIVAAVDVGITVGDGFAIEVGWDVGAGIGLLTSRLQAAIKINNSIAMLLKQECRIICPPLRIVLFQINRAIKLTFKLKIKPRRRIKDCAPCVSMVQLRLLDLIVNLQNAGLF